MSIKYEFMTLDFTGNAQPQNILMICRRGCVFLDLTTAVAGGCTHSLKDPTRFAFHWISLFIIKDIRHNFIVFVVIKGIQDILLRYLILSQREVISLIRSVNISLHLFTLVSKKSFGSFSYSSLRSMEPDTPSLTFIKI